MKNTKRRGIIQPFYRHRHTHLHLSVIGNGDKHKRGVREETFLPMRKSVENFRERFESRHRQHCQRFLSAFVLWYQKASTFVPVKQVSTCQRFRYGHCPPDSRVEALPINLIDGLPRTIRRPNKHDKLFSEGRLLVREPVG